MTFGLLFIIGMSLLIKLVLGAIYSLKYRCTHPLTQFPYNSDGQNSQKIKSKMNTDNKISKYFDSIKQDLENDVKNNIVNMFKDIIETEAK